jgi:hypothetical protein
MPHIKPGTAECPASSYVLSFQTDSFRHQTRYHWMVCGAQNPDELVSWGYAPTQDLAAAAAREEINDLSSGLSRGGRVISTSQAFSNRRSGIRGGDSLIPLAAARALKS